MGIDVSEIFFRYGNKPKGDDINQVMEIKIHLNIHPDDYKKENLEKINNFLENNDFDSLLCWKYIKPEIVQDYVNYKKNNINITSYRILSREQKGKFFDLGHFNKWLIEIFDTNSGENITSSQITIYLSNQDTTEKTSEGIAHFITQITQFLKDNNIRYSPSPKNEVEITPYCSIRQDRFPDKKYVSKEEMTGEQLQTQSENSKLCQIKSGVLSVYNNIKKATTAVGIIGIASGIFSIGLIIAPFTFGSSVVISAFVIGFCVGGGILGVGSSIFFLSQAKSNLNTFFASKAQKDVFMVEEVKPAISPK